LGRRPAVLSDVQTVDVAVPIDIASKIDSIAVARRVSRNRALSDLLRDAISAYEDRRTAFMELADRFERSTDPVVI
jgi:hypothetical protein